MFVGLLGFFIFGICLIFLIWAAAKKKLKRWWALGMLAGFILFIVGVSIDSSPSTADHNTPNTSIASNTPIKTTVTSTSITASSSASVTNTSDTLEVYYFDVGQGDAELLRIGDDTMLIDAGTNASTNALIADIKNLGITDIDYVVGTHPHEDHVGGMDAVISRFDIGTVLMPTITADTKTYKDVISAIDAKHLKITAPIPGSNITLGPVTCTILAPNSLKYDDLNNYSIVLCAVYGNESFLFTGDAEELSESEILAKGYNVDSDVLKVGHHGSNSSTTPDFLKVVSPTCAIIEVGAGNDYGHPAQATLDKLSATGATIYRTDLNGTIKLTSNGSTINISPSIITTSPAVTTSTSAPVTSITTTAAAVMTTTTASASKTTTTIVTTTTKTTTPTTTTATNSTLSLDIISVTSPVSAGSNATLTVRTSPGAQCNITVYYKSGASSASGLGSKTADSDGNVSWTWKVGAKTTAGTWKIVVSASINGQSITKNTTFTVE